MRTIQFFQQPLNCKNVDGSDIKMRFPLWRIFAGLILILLLLLLPVPLRSSSWREVFNPSTSGETWEQTFHLADLGDHVTVYLQEGAFAQYNITIWLDLVETTQSFIRCRYEYPPLHSVNNNPNFIDQSSQRFYVADGESISFVASSSIHLGSPNVRIQFDQFNSSDNFPSDGLSGKIRVQVLELGLRDNSLYRTTFQLGSNQTAFDSQFDVMIIKDGVLTSYGVGAELKVVIESAPNSTGAVLFNVSNTFYDIYRSPRMNHHEYTTLQPLLTPPGTIQEQNFLVYNDEGDSLVYLPFALSLVNQTAEAFGNLTLYLLEMGSTPPNPFAPPIWILFASIGIILLAVTLPVVFFAWMIVQKLKKCK